MRINGAGCCLVDSIYMNCSYEDISFRNLMSVEKGDGGLIEGGLVFSEDIEVFAKRPYKEILHDLSKGRSPDIVNLGGPSVVALVHASQILAPQNVEVSFYGATGKDEYAQIIRQSIEKTPLHALLKEIPDRRSATTDVFDDPTQRNGKGERSFINTIGAAGYYGEEDLPDSFYDADVVLLGGTALVPRLHDGLHKVLEKAKKRGCMTVVGTVYDFRAEKADPNSRWPLGDYSSYKNIDLLVTDEEEALRLSGKCDVIEAADALISFGVGALIITRGALDILAYSDGRMIRQCGLKSFPVSEYMDELMAKDPSLRKDTTGCGDNFVGGVLVALGQHQLKEDGTLIEIKDICAWGAASGGLTCTYHGGTYYEKEQGEKEKLLQPVVQAYLSKIGEIE